MNPLYCLVRSPNAARSSPASPARSTGVGRDRAARFSESLLGLYVNRHFYVPKDVNKPAATIFYLCGHQPGPAGPKPSYQNDGVSGSPRTAIPPGQSLSTSELGEAPSAFTTAPRRPKSPWNWLSLGYTPAGVEVWNAMRALDYLQTRPEVDPKKIGLTGISGGGAMTWYTAAVDERIAAAVPVCSTYTFGSQAAHWLQGANATASIITTPGIYSLIFMSPKLIALAPCLDPERKARSTIFPPPGYYHECLPASLRTSTSPSR